MCCFPQFWGKNSAFVFVGPAAIETRESGQPAGGLQEEETAPLGVRVLRADGPQ